MISMEKFLKKNEEPDNEVIVNGYKVLVTDEVANKIMALIGGEKQNLTEAAPKKKDHHINAGIAAGCSNVKAKWKVEEKVVNNKKFYAIIPDIFTAGKWYDDQFNPGMQYRKECNLEAKKVAYNHIKRLENIKADNSLGYFVYGYTNKKTAEAMMAKLPEHIDKMEIAAIIEANNGKLLQGKTYHREAPKK